MIPLDLSAYHSPNRIRCCFLEPTDRVRQALRRYSSSGTGVSCPAMPGAFSYHSAEAPIEDAPAIEREDGVLINGSQKEVVYYATDPRWPTHCACGYAFAEDDPRQLFVERIYRRADTGAEMTLRAAPAGAMWYAPWLGDSWHPQLGPGKMLVVRLPDGTDWEPDMQARNCTIPDDRGMERHHCWVLHGTPPDLTADKNGVTCQAGAGSILSPSHSAWHGFLREGYLEPC